MRTEHRILRLGALLVAGCGLARQASAQAIQGATYDPAPVTFSRVGLNDTRPVASMDLLALRDVKGLSISPNGKYVAFVVGQAVYEKNGYRSGLFIVSTSDHSKIQPLGTAGIPHWDGINQWIPESPQWSRDSKQIWYRACMRSGGRWALWEWDVASSRRRKITRVAGDIQSYRYIPDSQILFFTVVGGHRDERGSPRGESGIRFTGQIRPYQNIPVLEQLKAAEEPSREYWVHNLRTNQERPATAKEIRAWSPGQTGKDEDLDSEQLRELAKHHVVETQASPDGNTVAFIYAVDDPAISRMWSRRLLLHSKTRHSWEELTPTAYFVDQVWWTADGTTLYFSVREGRGHSPELWKVSPGNSQPQMVFRATGSEYVSSFASDARGRKIACLFETNSSPPRVALLDAMTQTLRILADPNPGFDSLQRFSAERIEGANRFGDPWFAYLVKPLNYKPEKRYPLIITTYRSGDYFLRGGSGDENPIQVYAANGFAVLSFDVGFIRNISPGHFEEKLQDWASPTASLEAAVKELTDRHIIDPERVGIAGFSHGEEIAGYAVTHTHLFQAAVGAAFYDPCFYFLGGADWWRLFEDWGLGGWPEGRSKSHWHEIAMSLNADRIETAILENASDTEYLIYLPVYCSLSDLHKPVRLYIYPQELHVRNQPQHRYEIYERNLDWFCFWLKDEERPGLKRQEQYRDWRQLRASQRGQLQP